VGSGAKHGDSFLATIGGSFANHMARNWRFSANSDLIGNEKLQLD
jgi:hypothetical protein